MFLKDSGVNRKVVYPLFALLDERVVVDFPSQVLDFAMHFLQRLIHGNRSDRYRRIPQNGLAGLVNVLAGREVHYGIGSPLDRPHGFLHFLFDGGAERRIAYVGVDLDEEFAADNHGLCLGVTIV